ncbi:MAG: hypothetical protein Q4G34_07530 [Micrococcus sp.]|nr:hypothetical protein [Micrococcus sp.]
MSRAPESRINDILIAIERCRQYVAYLGGPDTTARMAEDAIARNLQIIGEVQLHTALRGHGRPDAPRVD